MRQYYAIPLTLRQRAIPLSSDRIARDDLRRKILRRPAGDVAEPLIVTRDECRSHLWAACWAPDREDDPGLCQEFRQLQPHFARFVRMSDSQA